MGNDVTTLWPVAIADHFLCENPCEKTFLKSAKIGKNKIRSAKEKLKYFKGFPIREEVRKLRVNDYESVGRRFESYWARQKIQGVSGITVNPFL